MLHRSELFVRVALAAVAVLLVAGCGSYDKMMAQGRAFACVNEADRQIDLGHNDQARVWLDRAVALNPDDPSTYFGPESSDDDDKGGQGIAQCLLSHNDWPDVVYYLGKAAVNPKINSDVRVWEMLGQAQASLGQTAASQVSYRRGLAILGGAGATKGSILSPVDPLDLRMMRADVEWDAGLHEKSRSDYNRIIAEFPQSAAGAQNDLAYGEADSNVDLPEAYTLAKAAVNAVRQDPDSSDLETGEYLDTRAWTEFRLGKLNEAVQDAEEAISDDPQEPVIHYHLAAIFHALKDDDDARIEIDRAVSLSPSDFQIKSLLSEIEPRGSETPAT